MALNKLSQWRWMAIPPALPLGLAYWSAIVLTLLLLGNLTAWTASLDRNLLSQLAKERGEFKDEFFGIVTWGGSLFALLPASGVAIRWLGRRGRTLDAWRLGLSLAGTVAGVYLAKAFLAIPRPHLFSIGIPEPSSQSFPSAHTAQIVAVVAAACFIRPRQSNRSYYGLLIAGMLLAGLVGLSRVYLQVHYPSDVLGGAAYAVIWMLALESLLRRKNPGTNA